MAEKSDTLYNTDKSDEAYDETKAAEDFATNSDKAPYQDNIAASQLDTLPTPAPEIAAQTSADGLPLFESFSGINVVNEESRYAKD